jgi:hypothetical protein
MTGSGKVFVARETFWVGSDLVVRGTRVREGHSFLKGREGLFREEDPIDFEHEPESVQEPSEVAPTQQPVKRGRGRPRKNPLPS